MPVNKKLNIDEYSNSIFSKFNIDPTKIKNTDIKNIPNKKKWEYFKKYFNQFKEEKDILESTKSVVFYFKTPEDAEKFSNTAGSNILAFVRKCLTDDGENYKQYRLNIDFSNTYEPGKSSVRFTLI